MKKIFRLKSMAELLADGWTVGCMDDGEPALRRPLALAIRQSRWPRLGGLIELTARGSGSVRLYDGWVDDDLVQWSKLALERVVAGHAPPPAVEPCSCDRKILFDYGCRCGGFQRERAAALAGRRT